MRIIAGSKRGMKLLGPRTGESRPILDRVKESLFSVLYKYGLPDGKMAADLFSGVGSLGLEALSRGAEFVAFVEKDPKVITILNKNIENAGFVKQSRVVRADAFKVGAPVDRQKYNLIFVDPPYADTKDTGQDSPLGRLLSSVSRQLATNGIVVVRTNRQTELLKQYGLLEIVELRQWGTMAVTILSRRQ